MKKRNETRPINILYVKLPKYEVPFMRVRHGCPSVFGSLSAYDMILTNHLVCNPFLSYKYTEMSFSSYAYDLMIQGSQNLLFENGIVPKSEDKDGLLAVVIPKEAVAYDDEHNLQAVETNKHYQLSRLGAQAFRARAYKEFWTTLGVWLKEGEERVVNETPGLLGRVTRKDLLLQFMKYYGIEVEHFESIYRHLQRNLERL